MYLTKDANIVFSEIHEVIDGYILDIPGVPIYQLSHTKQGHPEE